jgi:hypothetical protein
MLAAGAWERFSESLDWDLWILLPQPGRIHFFSQALLAHQRFSCLAIGSISLRNPGVSLADT